MSGRGGTLVLLVALATAAAGAAPAEGTARTAAGDSGGAEAAERARDLGVRGRDLLLSGRISEAEPLLSEALELVQGIDDPRAEAFALEGMFLLRVGQRRLDDAEALVEPLLQQVRLQGDAALLDAARERVALAFRGQDAFEAALRVWQATLRDKEAVHGADAAALIPTLLALGGAQADAGDLDGAEVVFERARKLLLERAPGQRAALGETYFALGNLHLVRGNRGRGEALLGQAVEEFEIAGADSPQFAAALLQLGSLRAEQEDLDGACARFQQGVDVTERQTGNSPGLLSGLLLLSGCETQRGRFVEADQVSQRALALARRLGGGPPGAMAELLAIRVAVLRGLGRDEDARHLLERLRSLGADAAAGLDG